MTSPRGVVLGRPQQSAAGARADPTRGYLCIHRGLWGGQPGNKPGWLGLLAQGGWRTQAGKQQVCRVGASPPVPQTLRPSCGSISGSQPGSVQPQTALPQTKRQCKVHEQGTNTRPALV